MNIADSFSQQEAHHPLNDNSNRLFVASVQKSRQSKPADKQASWVEVQQKNFALKSFLFKENYTGELSTTSNLAMTKKRIAVAQRQSLQVHRSLVPPQEPTGKLENSLIQTQKISRPQTPATFRGTASRNTHRASTTASLFKKAPSIGEKVKLSHQLAEAYESVTIRTLDHISRIKKPSKLCMESSALLCRFLNLFKY